MQELIQQQKHNVARGVDEAVPGAEVIKLFSCSTLLSMKFKMLINIEIAKIDGILGLIY